MPAELPRYTDRTITDRGELDRELDSIRHAGYAVCDREYEEFTSGASAAVLNARQAPMAVIEVWGLASRNPLSRLHEIGMEAAETAKLVQARLD